MTTPDIDMLLALDTTRPAAALAFRRGVAELAGYHTEQFKDGYWYLLDPAGKHHPFGNFGAEASCWQHLPLFEMSVDAALTLPLDGEYFFDLHGPCADGVELGEEKFYAWVSWRWEDEEYPDYEGKAPNGALAVCRAWLRYRAAQSAPVATARDEEA